MEANHVSRLVESANARRTDGLAAGTAAVDPGDALAAVQDLVDQYNKSGNPGQFSVTQDGAYLHIQQTARMVNGKLQPFELISGTLLQWQPKSENCYRVLTDLSSALTQARGFGIAQGNLPSNLLMYHCKTEKDSLTVQQALEAVIEGLDTDPATGKKTPSSSYTDTWDLVYDPNWNKYFLSLTSVQLKNLPAAVAPAPSQTPTTTGAPKQAANRTGSYTATKPPR